MRIQAKAAIVFSILLVTSTAVPSAAQACITRRVEGTTIVLINTCGQYVSWAMCVRVSGRGFDDYPVGVVAPKGSSRYGLYIDANVAFTSEVAWCRGKGCKLIQPRCSDPKPRQDQTADAPPVRYCPTDLTPLPGSDARAREHNKLVEMCKVAFPDAKDGSRKADSADRPVAKRGVKQQPTVGTGQAQQNRSGSNRELLNALSLGLTAAAGSLSKQPAARAPLRPATSPPTVAAGQFPCRDRRQYEACIPQYISRGLPYGYEGRDIRQVAHEYCQRNFCQ